VHDAAGDRRVVPFVVSSVLAVWEKIFLLDVEAGVMLSVQVEDSFRLHFRQAIPVLEVILSISPPQIPKQLQDKIYSRHTSGPSAVNTTRTISFFSLRCTVHSQYSSCTPLRSALLHLALSLPSEIATLLGKATQVMDACVGVSVQLLVSSL
jgi:hypothetical protein